MKGNSNSLDFRYNGMIRKSLFELINISGMTFKNKVANPCFWKRQIFNRKIYRIS